MGALLAAELSKNTRAPGGIKPTSPRYEGGILPLDDQCLSVAESRADHDLNSRSNRRSTPDNRRKWDRRDLNPERHVCVIAFKVKDAA